MSKLSNLNVYSVTYIRISIINSIIKFYSVKPVKVSINNTGSDIIIKPVSRKNITSYAKYKNVLQKFDSQNYAAKYYNNFINDFIIDNFKLLSLEQVSYLKRKKLNINKFKK